VHEVAGLVPLATLLLAGCADDLLPGESILGVDVPAVFTTGGARDQLGAEVAWSGDSWLATAPGAGQVWRDGVATDAPAADAGFWGQHVVTVSREGEVFVDGEPAGAAEGAPAAVAIGAPGVAVATADAIALRDPEGLRAEVRIDLRGVTSLAWGEERLLGLVCDPTCEGRVWSREGEDLGGFADGGEGGAVGEWHGRAWVGDPQLTDPDGAGLVRSEDGDVVAGAVGDHLGAAIGAGRAAGTFNKWVVPARARLVPLEGGEVLSMEIGAENQPIRLAGDDDVLVVGAPFYPANGHPSGAVVVAR
jgi:hypothetical protein